MAYKITENDRPMMTTRLHLSGNMIPDPWLQRIVFAASKKPHWLAAWVLGDICYWYSPTEVKDEATGALIGYAKKYGGEYLQRSYKDIAERTGTDKKQAQRACKQLSDMGLIKIHYLTLVKSGTVLNNVVHLEPVINEIHNLTYSESWPMVQDNSLLTIDPMDMDVIPYGHECTEGMDTGGDTNTYTTTNTTTKKNTIAKTFVIEDDLLSKPFTELEAMCTEYRDKGYIVVINYWWQLSGKQSPKLQSGGGDTAFGTKFKNNYKNYVKSNPRFLKEIWSVLREFQFNVLPLKHESSKKWLNIEFILGPGKPGNGPGWLRLADKEAFFYFPDSNTTQASISGGSQVQIIRS